MTGSRICEVCGISVTNRKHWDGMRNHVCPPSLLETIEAKRRREEQEQEDQEDTESPGFDDRLQDGFRYYPDE